jgi:hypothetical protein
MSRFWGSGKFPYTNINNLNLDWMIKLVLELKAQVAAIVGELGTVYVKPETGIPKSDLSAGVQASLDKADSALQSVPSTYRTAAAQDLIDTAQNEQITPLYTGNTLTGSTVAAAIPHKSLIKTASLEILPEQIGTPSVEQHSTFQTFSAVTINNNAFALPSGFYGGVLDHLTGKVKAHARVITFDGSESWSPSISGSDNRKYFSHKIGKQGSFSTASTMGYCNAYTRASITSNNTTVGFNIGNSSAYNGCMLNIRPADSGSMNGPAWKAKLAEYANNGNPIQILVWEIETDREYLTNAIMDRVQNGAVQLTADIGSWTLEYNDYIGTLSEFAASRAAVELLSANSEEDFTASKAYYVNDFLVIRDSLLKVTAPIQSGGTIQIGVNAVITTLGAEITAILNS